MVTRATRSNPTAQDSARRTAAPCNLIDICMAPALLYTGIAEETSLVRMANVHDTAVDYEY